MIPILRALTRPLRAVPLLPGAISALVLGGAIGIGVFALATETRSPRSPTAIHDAIRREPGVSPSASRSA